MPELDRSDKVHLDAAQGWLGLGDHIQANEELEKITPQLRAHPDVLRVRWRVYAQAKKWGACCEIGRTLTELEPDKPGGWNDHAQSLHRLDRTEEAYDLLASAASRFPDQPTIFYHLAVYGCHLRKLSEAWNWLKRAFEIGDAKQIKLKALHDSDLEPLGGSSRNLNVIASSNSLYKRGWRVLDASPATVVRGVGRSPSQARHADHPAGTHCALHLSGFPA